MPFKPVEQVKCPKCSKSVYAAEERAVGELKYHKECYKCSMCNKMLDSTNMAIHEITLFCKVCHGRKYGPKGYGFGGGAAGLSMDTGAHLEYGRDDTIKEYKPPAAAPGEGCPRCGGKVFAAEEMFAKGRSYHKTCFNCKTCRKPLDSVLHCDGPDKEVYCKVCYGGKFGPKGYGYGHGAGTLQSRDPEVSPMVRAHGDADFYSKAAEGEEGCPRCGGKVYQAEMMLAKGRPFHKKCFKCLCCKRPLDSMIHCDGPDGEVYCKLCYSKKYGPKGYGFASGSGGVLTAENIEGGADPGLNPASATLDVSAIQAAPGEGCPRCGGKVFMAEEMFARGRSWHKQCFSCCHCHRPLDSVVGCDAPDGEVYCKLCYAKKYGPKGYGFASGAGGVLSAENIGTEENRGVESKRIAFTCLDVSKIQAAEGEGCPRCGGKVFMAEEIHARARSWHKKCYSCCHCHRPLDSVVGCDAPDGEVYCKLCYAKKYGPKGYGFASGSGGVLTAENIPGGGLAEGEVNPASVAIDTASIMAAPGEGCPRCGGKVFSAEEMLSRNNKWHKRCYSCCDCHRPLDSMVLCDGPDSEIYCKLCYAKKFGPKGYGFASGAGGVLVPESVSVDGDMGYVTNPSKQYNTNIKDLAPAKEGQARCPRCGGAVFQAESMCSRNKEWHKQCYSCVECHRPLDSMSSCDAPDGEIYCKLCYAKRHGPKGYGYGQTAALVSLGTHDGTPVPADIRQFGFGTGNQSQAREFLEGQIRQPIVGGETQTKTTHMQKVIVNQIKNLPAAGRVPRGLEQTGRPQVAQEEVPEVMNDIPQSANTEEEEYESEEEVIPTSEFTTQTSPVPPMMEPQTSPPPIHPQPIEDLQTSPSPPPIPIQPLMELSNPPPIPPQPNIEPELLSNLEDVQQDPTNAPVVISSERLVQMTAVQQQMQQAFAASNNAVGTHIAATQQRISQESSSQESHVTMQITNQQQFSSNASEIHQQQSMTGTSETQFQVSSSTNQMDVSGQVEVSSLENSQSEIILPEEEEEVEDEEVEYEEEEEEEE